MAIDRNDVRSRRALLFGAAGGLVALAAQAFGRPAAAEAGTGSVKLGAWNSSADTTTIRNGVDDSTIFRASSDHGGIGIRGVSRSGQGLSGQSRSGIGVLGESDGNGTGVLGRSQRGNGVVGSSERGNGVTGYARGPGAAVYGEFLLGGEPPGPGVKGVSHYGPGVAAESALGPAVYASGATGVHALGGDVAVAADCSGGVGVLSSGYVGGQFAGVVAQVRLRPSSDTTHPAVGAAGDLFLDASVRLWLCKGGATWVRLD